MGKQYAVYLAIHEADPDEGGWDSYFWEIEKRRDPASPVFDTVEDAREFCRALEERYKAEENRG